MKRFLLILLLTSTAQAALLEYYIDPDVVGGLGDGSSWANAYSSLNACEAARAQDLTDSGGDTMIWWCRASSGTADTTAVTIDGNTEDATHYLTIRGYDFPSDGVYDATKYRMLNDDAAAEAISISDTYTRLQNLQVVVNCSGTNTRRGIRRSGSAASAIYISNCLVVAGSSMTGTGTAIGIAWADAGSTVTIYNTVVSGFISASSPADTDFYGCFLYSGTCYLYNCTLYGNSVGIEAGPFAGVDVTVTNIISGNANDDFVCTLGTITIDYCASDDGDGTNPVAPSGGNWANEFVNAAGGNFALKAGGNCVNGGTDNPGSGLYLDDIIGTTRVTPWDIGAFEIAGVGVKYFLFIE